MIRSTCGVLFILLLLVSGQAISGEHVQENDFKQALRKMLTERVDPFLIVEIYGTQKYIQFYNENPGILLDLPVNSLSDLEVDKATQYFNKFNIEARLISAKDIDTRGEFILKGWSKVFDVNEFDKVVSIAYGVLFEVYGISYDTPLSFIKGWE
jgi:hypothetical protein